MSFSSSQQYQIENIKKSQAEADIWVRTLQIQLKLGKVE